MYLRFICYIPRGYLVKVLIGEYNFKKVLIGEYEVESESTRKNAKNLAPVHNRATFIKGNVFIWGHSYCGTCFRLSKMLLKASREATN